MTSSGARVYHISATIYHGMSGGPLVNECGEVVGVDGPRRVAMGKDLDVDRADYSIHVDELFPCSTSRSPTHDERALCSQTRLDRRSRDPEAPTVSRSHPRPVA